MKDLVSWLLPISVGLFLFTCYISYDLTNKNSDAYILTNKFIKIFALIFTLCLIYIVFNFYAYA